VRVVRKNLGNAKGVVETTAANEKPGAHDGGTPLVPAWTLGQQVERFPGLVPQISTYDMGGGAVDEIPGVNAVMPAQIQLAQVSTPIFGGRLLSRLEVHDADRDNPRRMVRPIQ
jgi:hypothetical protein